VRINQSGASLFLRCAEAYRRRYIEGDIIPPTFVLHRGSSVHKVAAASFARKRDRGRPLSKKSTVELAVETFEQSVRAQGVYLMPDEESARSKLHDDTLNDVRRLSALFATTVVKHHDPDLIEEKIEVPFTGDHLLHGTLDLTTRESRIVDLKNRSKAGRADEYRRSLQFVTYGLLYLVKKQTMPKGFVAEELVLTKEATNNTIELEAPEQVDFHTAIIQYTRIADAIGAGAFPGAYGNAHAWWCSADSCGYWWTCPLVPEHRRRRPR